MSVRGDVSDKQGPDLSGRLRGQLQLADARAVDEPTSPTKATRRFFGNIFVRRATFFCIVGKAT